LELDRLKGVQNGLQESILASEILPAEVEKQRKLDIKYRQDLTTLQELETKLRIKNNTLVIAKSKGTPEEVQALKDQITALERSIVLQDKRTENAKRNASDIGQVLDNVSNSFESGMISAFDSIIQGTSSVKDAFRNMAISILQSLSQVIARMLAVKIIQAAIEGLTPSAQSLGQVSADGQAGGLFDTVNPQADGLIPGLSERTGGIVSNGREVPGFSMGGVAKGRDAGYPVTLHGTEAVVPLPNNREIPVQLLGGSGQTNNVSINVSVDSNGNAQQDSQQSSTQAGQLGQAISLAIRKELQNQKRSGGILNPYGVA
jgi:hypothetical protein